MIFTFGEFVRSVSNTHIFIDLHLPRLRHLHDARRLSHVRGVSVRTCPHAAILKSPAISRNEYSLVMSPEFALRTNSTFQRLCGTLWSWKDGAPKPNELVAPKTKSWFVRQKVLGANIHETEGLLERNIAKWKRQMLRGMFAVRFSVL